MRHKGTLMELLTNTPKLKNAIQTLEENMKKKSKTLPASLRGSLIKLINKNPDLITVKGKKIIISVQFYPVWIKEHKLNKHTEMLDSEHYKFFRKLRKYGYIHTMSSYFPKKLSVITLNPTLPSLYKGNMKHISNYDMGKQSLYKTDNFDKNVLDAYIDLRIYQAFMLTVKEVEAINTSNIIFVDENIAYIYFEDKGIFDNIEIPPYHLFSIRGSKLISILRQFKENDVIYPFVDTTMESELEKHKKKFFNKMGMREIRMSAQNHLLMTTSPLETSLVFSRKIMSPLTIAELRDLPPSSDIPKHLKSFEKRRIENAIDRAKSLDDEDNEEHDLSFSLEEFDYFDELMKTKSDSDFMRKLEPVKRELLQYTKSKTAETHGILIAKYIAYLLSTVNGNKKIRKIAISTFRNYYSLVKKHLFDNIEDLSSVQTHEINEILQNLAINKYKDKSISKVKGLIADFFSFHGKQHNVIPMNLASYPKSLVFESEIDPILLSIDDMYDKRVQGRGTDYERLRDKAIVLMAKYTGLRKSELRSRLMKDVYIYEKELCIDVNSRGLRKLDMKLKTHNAKRRVCTTITNKDHLKIIVEYIEAREKVRNKNPYLFLHVDDKNKIKSKVAEEDVFNQIGKIIQKVTERYTSFHSLRHTYATYAVRDILQCERINPYKMIDLAVKMGHTSPEITLKKYTHRTVIECILTNKDKK